MGNKVNNINYGVQNLTREKMKLLYLFLGALIGGIVGHRLALGRDKRKDFNDAAKIFRDSFTDEIRLLKKSRPRRPDWSSKEPDTAYKIIKKALAAHDVAYISFKYFLNKHRQKAFDESWREYSNHLSEYDSGGDYAKEKEIRKTILCRIDYLCNFAKMK